MSIDPHAPGAKLDHGKVRMGLVLGGFRHALQAVGEVGTFGAAKYSDNGWLEVPNGKARYEDALFRHLLADDECDDESGLLHKAHAAWNALAILELHLREAKLAGIEEVVFRECREDESSIIEGLSIIDGVIPRSPPPVAEHVYCEPKERHPFKPIIDAERERLGSLP